MTPLVMKVGIAYGEEERLDTDSDPQQPVYSCLEDLDRVLSTHDWSFVEDEEVERLLQWSMPFD